MKPIPIRLINRTQVKVQVHESEKFKNDQEVVRSATCAAATAPVLIAIWAIACLFGGLIASGGFQSLFAGWLSAVSGM